MDVIGVNGTASHLHPLRKPAREARRQLGRQQDVGALLGKARSHHRGVATQLPSVVRLLLSQSHQLAPEFFIRDKPFSSSASLEEIGVHSSELVSIAHCQKMFRIGWKALVGHDV